MPPGRSAANPSWFVRTSTSASPCAGPFFLLHAAGEQEDFRPLFLPGPPALVLWSGAVPRGCPSPTCDKMRRFVSAENPCRPGRPRDGISAPRPEIPARSWRTAGSPYYFSAPGWGKCSRTPASRNTGGAPGGFYDQARAWRLERRDFAQRSTYFEVKAGRGGKRARRRVDRYLRKLQI